jgi:hypothetical protein
MRIVRKGLFVRRTERLLRFAWDQISADLLWLCSIRRAKKHSSLHLRLGGREPRMPATRAALFGLMLLWFCVDDAYAQQSSLQALVDSAAPGDTISLLSATYAGDVRISKPLFLTGTSPASTIIVGQVYVTNTSGVILKRMTFRYDQWPSVPTCIIESVDSVSITDIAIIGHVSITKTNSLLVTHASIGFDTALVYYPRQPSVSIDSSRWLCFTDVTVTGLSKSLDASSRPWRGGDAVHVTNSADLELKRMTITGGKGADGWGVAGWGVEGANGGDGLTTLNTRRMIIDQSVFSGGAGGNGGYGQYSGLRPSGNPGYSFLLENSSSVKISTSQMPSSLSIVHSDSVSLDGSVVIGNYLYDGSSATSPGTPAISASNSNHIVILNTSMTGGPGGRLGSDPHGVFKGRGGDGFASVRTTNVSIDGSTISGGNGAPSDSSGFSVRLEDSSRASVSNTQLHCDYSVDSSSVLLLENSTGVHALSITRSGPFELAQNYPNPFNPSTTIRYGVPTRSHVLLTVFNTLSQQVAVLQNGEQDTGYHEVRFDGSRLSSGAYFYRIEAGSFVQTRKLLLIR